MPMKACFSSRAERRCAIGMVWFLLPGMCALLSLPPALAAARRPPPRLADAHIYTWIGNTRPWDRRLHVSGYRLGCDTGDPQGCVREASQAVAQEGLSQIFLSMFMDPRRTVDDARAYSRLSLSHPYLVEAGFDDFVDRYQNLFGRPGFDPVSWLRSVVRAVKSDNANLAFGITLYEDELDSPYLRPPYLPADVARSVGYVHLYLHYRTDAPYYALYVERTKRLFPQARVIAGLYAYDRIDYIPCAPAKPHAACAPGEEIQLYQQALSAAAQMMKDGRIAGIEFYPGFFGREAEWGGWKHPDYCAPARVAQCIDDTHTMREKTVAVLSAALGW